jgi:hypothetical protein
LEDQDLGGRVILMDFTEIEDRDQCNALANTIMNYWVP